MEALDIKPDDHQLLHDLLELFSETKQWKKAMEILHALAELETAARARHVPDRGGQHRATTSSTRTDEAIELYNQAPRRGPPTT